MQIEKNTVDELSASLGKIPQILKILVEKNKLTNEQSEDILFKIKNDEAYKGMFAGEVAISLGYVSDNDLAEGLNWQAKQIAKAAVEDIQIIDQRRESLVFPTYMQNPHWGNNNSVNEIEKNLTKTTAVSGAANVAKIIVQLANKNPQEITDDVKKTVSDLKNLTIGMIKGNSSIYPIKERAEEWIKNGENTLRDLAKKNDVNQEIVDKYIENRFYEIRFGVEKTLEQSNTVTREL